MRKLLLISVCCTLIFPAIRAEKRWKEENKRFNFGLIAGVNAPFVNNRSILVDWKESEKPDNESGIGATVALFGRTNINRNYLQVEIGTSFFRNQTVWDLNEFYTTATSQTNINTSVLTLDIPLLYGYNFVKRQPYELSLFAGPKMRYTYKYKESAGNFGVYTFSIDEPIHPVTACFIVGMATKISRFILDFRYEFAITVQNKPGTYQLYEGETLLYQGNIYMKRATNLLSFSLGVIL